MRIWSNVTSIGHYDVVIVGAGSAGSIAAIAASRQGSKALLVEKLPFLGGNSTAVLDTFYGFYSPGTKPKRVVASIPQEIVSRLTTLGPVIERPNMYGAGTGVTYIADHLKVVWDRIVTESGTDVLLHCSLQDVEVSDGVVRTLLLATKSGLRTVSATTFVDASGDGDLCHFAEFGYELAGEFSAAQTLTSTFRMVNVDLDSRKQLTKEQLHDLMSKAANEGYELPRRDGSDHVTPVDGMTATVMTRLDSTFRDGSGQLHSILEPENLTTAEIEGRRQSLEYARFLTERVPGYERASLVGISTQIGLRETRRIFGDYRLNRDDVLSGQQFDDQIGLCAAPIEDHHSGDGTTWSYLPEGSAVGIPLRSLIVRDAQNVLVAGRCFSASHDAQASVRSMAQTMAMGQAAGTTAGLASATTSGVVRSVAAVDVRRVLRDAGAILDAEDVTQ